VEFMQLAHWFLLADLKLWPQDNVVISS